MSELTEATVRITADLNALRDAFGLRLQPAMENFAAALREVYNSWPGMPYTAPSRWDAEQMKADR